MDYFGKPDISMTLVNSDFQSSFMPNNWKDTSSLPGAVFTEYLLKSRITEYLLNE